ncbi:hypothetical protein [Flavihumibacter profundi]|uniref:hypothetical protein n=1 Tax=Flavihumibacter profundi TaxID=2716883 RepID=UPI001CC3E0C8|nr:hypothetical protein [Flavihumibacter profundi]MBZ5858627.1 hypothetical protein [Flavihumibacter profundi]
MKALALVFSLFVHAVLFAQSDSIRLEFTIGEQLNDFAVDNLGNIFLVSESGQLKKLSPKGDSIAVFNDVRRFGKLFSIDVSNPLKVLLFYKDFGTVVVLDRMLNNRNIIDFRKQNIMQAKAIGQSYDNGVWVYDELDAKLKRLDDNGTVISETADFRVLIDAPPSPVYLVDANRLVYLYDPEKGLIALDYFGTIRNKVAILGWTDVQVIGNRILGRKGKILVSYALNSMDLREQDMKSLLQGVKKIQLAMDHLYCLKDGVLQVYTLSNHDQK